MAHRIYWRRTAEPGSSVTFVIACPDGCTRHPPGHLYLVGVLAPGRAARYAELGSVPAWLCGWGLPGAALLAALRTAAHDPNAVAGWVTPEGRRASQDLREGA